jgi:hypothetical protein
MKKCVLFFLFFAFSLCISSQNYKNDGNPYDYYCVVYYHSPSQDFSAIIVFDKRDKKNYLVDKSGKRKVFQTCVDLFNYMSKRGWRLIPSPERISLTGTECPEWLFIKTVRSDSEAKEGILVESDIKMK